MRMISMLRFTILLLSLGTLVLYGKALAGLGGYLAGNGRIDMIVLGLVGGTGTAVIALFLWKRYITEIYKERNDKGK